MKRVNLKPFDRVRGGDGHIQYEAAGRVHRVHHGWYRGEAANFLPITDALTSPQAFDDCILKGWLPERPLISQDSKIVTFGSCFAGNIARYLSSAGYTLLTKVAPAAQNGGMGEIQSKDEDSGQEDRVFVVACNEGIVNTFTMRQMFDWVYDGVQPTEAVWHDYDAAKFEFSEQSRVKAQEIFDAGDVFIVTVGLSEVWYNKETGAVFSRAIPRSAFDPDKHGFRVSTVAENLENLRTVIASIRRRRPNADIIITLSPVPLVATFRPVSCISANAVSKAILRVAVDEIMRERADDKHLFYWPSYEIVMYGFPRSTFKADGRHVAQEVLDFIMASFEAHYCVGRDKGDSRARLLLSAFGAIGLVPPRILEAVANRDFEPVAQWSRSRGNTRPELVDFVLSCYLADDPGNAPATNFLAGCRAMAAKKAETVRSGIPD